MRFIESIQAVEILHLAALTRNSLVRENQARMHGENMAGFKASGNIERLSVVLNEWTMLYRAEERNAIGEG
jgi:hypothetical protein